MSEDIERILNLEQPVEDVWRALTDPTDLAGWFGDTAELNPEKGGRGWFGWEKHGRFAVEVVEFVPMRKFAWRWAKDADTPLEDTPSTLVEWTLTERAEGGTRLHLRESGFSTDQHREDNRGGWTSELAELEQFLAAPR